MTLRATSLLPVQAPPRVERLSRLSARVADTLDAILVIIPTDASSAVFSSLPHAQTWRQMHAARGVQGRQTAPKSGPKAGLSPGSLRTVNLTNSRQTRLILGVMPRNASAFEILSLAGRMARDLGSCSREAIGVAAPSEAAGVQETTLEALLSATLACAFEMPSFRTSRKRAAAVRQILVLGGSLDLPRIGIAARANGLARWLTALPPNILDARGYRQVIGRLARAHGLGLRWLDERALRRAGANAFLAVAAGNAEGGAGIAHLRYRPTRRKSARPDVALIGKGILFDTGGVNLKTHRSMLDMHTDMAGSAVALATLIALAELRAPFAAEAWLAITENRIGPHAYRPQEVVRAANGVTIQVIHTDAEGRMVLADTLALAARTRPRLMIDFATLTGACVYSLTERMSGVFTNRPGLAAPLVEAGRVSGERVWNFPFESDYDADLESKVADIVQCTVDGKGDHILATRFLSRFVPAQIPWAHVDLSSATRSGGLAHVPSDVTGFGVRFALELLLHQDVLGTLRDAP
jgi:leucyl aminopeptidase